MPYSVIWWALAILGAALLLVSVLNFRATRRLTRRTDTVAQGLRSLDSHLGEVASQLAAARQDDVAAWESALAYHDKVLSTGKQGIPEKTRRSIAQDVNALLTLHSSLPLGGEGLPLTGWAASPDTLLHLTSLARQVPPHATIVEFGSGSSTVWMAMALKSESLPTKIVSLDHDQEYAALTREALARLGLDHVADVRYAPLRAAESNATPWYELNALRGVGPVGLLVVDGPPSSTGKRARYPAFPTMQESLIDGARIVLDDTDRREEKEIAESWIAEAGAIGELNLERTLERTRIYTYRTSPRP